MSNVLTSSDGGISVFANEATGRSVQCCLQPSPRASPPPAPSAACCAAAGAQQADVAALEAEMRALAQQMQVGRAPG